MRSDSISCIAEDPKGNLWLTTTNGLVRFDLERESFELYDKSSGLQGNEFNPNACYFSPATGELYVGGTDGFSVFDPLAITRNALPPDVVITGLRVLDKPFNYDSSGKTPVRLGYTQNFISFDFAALDFHSSSRNTFAYMLEGYEKAWVPAGTSHSASYTGLPAGNYTFRVKAANSDGTWSKTDATLQIEIIPPGSW